MLRSAILSTIEEKDANDETFFTFFAGMQDILTRAQVLTDEAREEA